MFVNACIGTQSDQVILIEKRGPRPDKTHVTFEDAPQLRQLVETCLA